MTDREREAIAERVYSHPHVSDLLDEAHERFEVIDDDDEEAEDAADWVVDELLEDDEVKGMWPTDGADILEVSRLVWHRVYSGLG
ncbi:MAG: hypothetical protein ABSA58_22905 [Acetobacteraceae bacterium]|jgi:hypothetical protein